MICRDAETADLPAVIALFRRSFTATFGHLYAPADLAGFLAAATPASWAGDALRLAELDGTPLGYARIGAVRLPVPVPAGARDLELRQLYLDEAAKGTGVADALLGWAMDRARANGGAALFLSVYVDNHRARRFYARHGFQDIGRYDFPVGDHVDEDRLMRLSL